MLGDYYHMLLLCHAIRVQGSHSIIHVCAKASAKIKNSMSLNISEEISPAMPTARVEYCTS